jgi:hypothetical protein
MDPGRGVDGRILTHRHQMKCTPSKGRAATHAQLLLADQGKTGFEETVRRWAKDATSES